MPITRSFILWIKNRIYLIELVFIPFVIFVLDSILRFAFQMDLIDVGTDMSLIALSSMIGLVLAEIDSGDGDSVKTGLFLTFLFFGLWILNLIVVSEVILIRFGINSDFTPIVYIITWSLGLSSVIFSSMLIFDIRNM